MRRRSGRLRLATKGCTAIGVFHRGNGGRSNAQKAAREEGARYEGLVPDLGPPKLTACIRKKSCAAFQDAASLQPLAKETRGQPSRTNPLI